MSIKKRGPKPRTMCGKNLHKMTEDNTYKNQDAKGRWHRKCRQCTMDTTNARKAKLEESDPDESTALVVKGRPAKIDLAAAAEAEQGRLLRKSKSERVRLAVARDLRATAKKDAEGNAIDVVALKATLKKRQEAYDSLAKDPHYLGTLLIGMIESGQWRLPPEITILRDGTPIVPAVEVMTVQADEVRLLNAPEPESVKQIEEAVVVHEICLCMHRFEVHELAPDGQAGGCSSCDRCKLFMEITEAMRVREMPP